MSHSHGGDPEVRCVAFLDLPIAFDEDEVNADGWRRRVSRQGTVCELLETWNIDDPNETSAMAQVLRHLRNATCGSDDTDGPPIGWTIVGIGDNGTILCESPTGHRRRYWLSGIVVWHE